MSGEEREKSECGEKERELLGVWTEWKSGEREEEARVRPPSDASQRAYERAYGTSRREARARKQLR